MSANRVDYVVVNVTPAICRTLAETEPQPFEAAFGGGSTPPVYTVHSGDTLSVTIWEAGSGGLFGTTSTLTGLPSPQGTPLPPLTVSQDGKITVPFAGRIDVAGETQPQIERLITKRLVGKADNPQVLVRVAQSQNNTVAVGGEVGKAAQIPLAIDGERILDAIAAAGGTRIPVNESLIRLIRGDRTASVSYLMLLKHPKENIYLQAGDVLTVERSPKTFTAFGAFGRNLQIPFGTDTVTAEEAVAKAGGLLDQRADPVGIFVFRYEPVNLVRRMAPGRPFRATLGGVPVIYHFDLSEPGDYFLAREFYLHDKDIVYAANAQLNEVQKFLNLLGSALSPAATGASVSTTVH